MTDNVKSIYAKNPKGEIVKVTHDQTLDEDNWDELYGQTVEDSFSLVAGSSPKQSVDIILTSEKGCTHLFTERVDESEAARLKEADFSRDVSMLMTLSLTAINRSDYVHHYFINLLAKFGDDLVAVVATTEELQLLFEVTEGDPVKVTIPMRENQDSES